MPAHAAVGESVELAKAESRGGAGLVNAVLRRAAREARAIVEALPEDTPQAAALRHSHPGGSRSCGGGRSAPRPRGR